MASPHVRQMVSAGWALMRAGNTRGAIREFTSALAAAPEDHDALVGLSQSHLNAGEINQADEPASALLRLAPELAVAHRLKAEVFRRKRQRGKALEFAKEAVRLDPDAPLGYHILALVQFDQKDYKAALKTVTEGRVVAPDYAVLAAQQALILLEMKGGKAAEPAANEALQLGMGDDYVLTIVARVAIARGRLEQARDLLDVVLQRDANDEEAISLYLLTNPNRYGLLRSRLQFPSWRKEHGVLGWTVWIGVWILLLMLAIAIVIGTHVPGIAVGVGYRLFWQAQYTGHRREVKKHFAKPVLRSGY
jgi:tetratricopeptide (TPR) repeat protein